MPPIKEPSVRRIRHIKPLGPRILIKLVKLEERSAAGLYLPEGVKEEHDEACYGQVVEVARAESGDEPTLGENVSGVPMGAFVLFPKNVGLAVPWDDTLRLLAVKNVVAVVEEVEPGEVQ
jgi:co-chaperonin GroES (HSP10)